MKICHLSICFSLFLGSLIAETPCPEEPIPEKVAWKNKVRVEVLKNLDDLLSWKLEEASRSFALTIPTIPLVYKNTEGFMKRFILLHGFFSLYQPLVGRVTGHLEDFKSAQCVLKAIAIQGDKGAWQRFAADELLTKVLAYRDLRLDEVWLLPYFDPEKGMELVPYKIDAVFNLWMGMPAYGFVPLEKGTPLLLFRGTDFSLDSPRGWASLMSDVDMAGPGLFTFQRAQPKIHEWLQKVADAGKKARILGYSLGGAFAAYAYIFEYPLIDTEGSVAFNLPGVTNAIIEKWNALPLERKQGFVCYVNQGDVVSKVGKLFGTVYQLSIDAPMKPLTAHTLLLSGQSVFYVKKVDVAAENSSREKSP